ncbi:SNF2-related protein, partial [Cypionkella sp.]|uniref:SNF2-related protein n=1 Tax=Cypionkella sp. TaxID=2811411 RepID=UPI003750D151
MDYKFKTKPYEHQLQAIKDCKDKVNWAFFMDMGTGKTKTTIDNLGMLYQEKKIESALIIAPKSVYAMWEKEINTHLSDDVSRYIQVWNLTKTKKINIINHKLLDTFSILLMNVEALSSKNGFENALLFLRINKKSAVIIDEATTIKNPKAKRTKHIHKIAPLAVVRRILTGSPITKSPLDLYAQCKFLDTTLLGYDSFYAFRARYAEMHTIYTGANQQVQIPKFYKNLDELEYKIKT